MTLQRALLVVLAASAHAVAQTPTRFELANGLRVWVQEDHARPVALVQVAYKVGAINEDPGTTGTAHYVEHMVYRATAHIHNEDVYGYIDRIGGRYTGGTSRDGTTYGETVPSWALEDALRTTAERMGRALFDSLEFERERNNVVTEANGFARQDPLTAYRDALMLASFEIHPYRYSSDTWARDNLAISRSDAYEFYKRYYGPNNAVLTIVGDVRPADVRRLVEKHFGPLARAPRSGEVRVVEPPQRVEKQVTLHYAGDRQYADLVYRAPAASQRDYTTLVVLDRVLAARLGRALAGIEVTTSHAATPYPFVYRIAMTASAPADVEHLVSVAETEVARLRTEDVTAAELAEARVEPVTSGRGGRGRGGAPAAQGGVPPRQSSLTPIANDLTARESFAWEVSTDTRQRIQRDRGERLGGRHQGVCGPLASSNSANRRPTCGRTRRLHAAVVERTNPCGRSPRGAAAHDAACAAEAADAGSVAGVGATLTARDSRRARRARRRRRRARGAAGRIRCRDCRARDAWHTGKRRVGRVPRGSMGRRRC